MVANNTIVNSWQEFIKLAYNACLKYDKRYMDRLKIELKEITKQGANNYWIRLYNSKEKFNSNKNGLVLPFVLGITDIDPIQNNIDHVRKFDQEFPDIDVDLLPEARDKIKKYAENKYGSEFVCNVGLWLTYKTKLALQDAAAVLGHNRHEIIDLLKDLPDEFDLMSKEQALEEFEQIRLLYKEKPEVVDLAYKMVGKIKSQGKHAGGLIISNCQIKDYIPLTLCGSANNKQWTSAWTEGQRSSQLSKFGFVKFDLLGLLNLSFIYNCKNLIKENKNITIEFDDMDPTDDRAGWIIYEDGSREKILLNDPETIQKANAVKMESIFQFDTNFAESIVEKGGVKSFNDLVIYTSLGRPGPLPMIDVYIKNRDDKNETWKKELHPKMLNILEETKGVLTFQEQLLRIWVEVCGLTMPEAEKLQKAVKKKRGEYLEQMGPRIVSGAAILIGDKKARELWDRMKSFGRYCFNKSHAVAYSMIAYRCLWLKTHFPAEWWAATLSECPINKTVQYIGAAKSEGIALGSLDCNKLTKNFSIDDNKITVGLSNIKGIGDSVSSKILNISQNNTFNNLEDFIDKVGKSKTILERLIKLGAFDKICKNRKALWAWYRYNYDRTPDGSKFRLSCNYCFAWPMEEIKKHIDMQINDYKKLYPKRNKIPAKILNWKPKKPWRIMTHNFIDDIESINYDNKLLKSIKLDFNNILQIFRSNYSLNEILQFEKQYLGYYLHSPLDMFIHSNNTTIADAKKNGVLECVIEDVKTKYSKNGKYLILDVTDGIQFVKITVWNNELTINKCMLEVGNGIRANVIWKDKWRSFSLKRNSIIVPLHIKDNYEI